MTTIAPLTDSVEDQNAPCLDDVVEQEGGQDSPQNPYPEHAALHPAGEESDEGLSDPRVESQSAPSDEELAAAADDGLEGSLERFLRFRGTREHEVLELQMLEVGGPPYPKSYVAHVTSDFVLEACTEGAKYSPMGIFFVMNAVNPAVRARVEADRWNVQGKGTSTSDADITSRRCIYFDFDPARPSGISSTEAESASARELALLLTQDLLLFLGSRGSSVGLALSGSGYHVHLALDDLPADEATKQIVAGLLAAVSLLYSTKEVKIDRTVSDAKRLCPVYGTIKAKGVNHPDRPHRLTWFWCRPEVCRLTRPDLEELLAAFMNLLTDDQVVEVQKAMGVKVPKSSGKATKSPGIPAASAAGSRAEGPFEEANAVPIPQVAEWLGVMVNGSPVCPGCGSTGDSSVALFANGLKCHHDSCADKGKPGKPGFRSVVDLVAEVKGVTPAEAVGLIAEEFGTTPLRGFANNANIANHPPGQSPEWLPPIAFATATCLPPFPTEWLPPSIGNWITAEAIATQTPPDLPAMVVLAVLATAVARTVHVVVREGWVEPLNLYIAVGLASANRKTAVVTDAKRPVQDHENLLTTIAAQKFPGEKAKREVLAKLYAQAVKATAKNGTAEGASELDDIASQLEKATPRPAPRLIADDITPEKLAVELEAQDGRLAILSSEGGAFDMMGGRYSEMPNLDVYLKAHAGEDIRVDRINRPSVHLKAPALTLGLTVQPDVLRGLADKPGFRGRGLLARFLYSLPASYIGSRDVRPPPVPDSIAQTYWGAITTLLDRKARPNVDGEHAPYELRFTDDAYEMLMDFNGDIESRMGADGDLANLTDWAGKLTGAVARLAALVHLVDQEVGEPVSTYSVECATRIGDYLLAHAKAAFMLMATDQEACDALYLLAWVQRDRKTAFTQREAFEGTKGRFSTVAQLKPILNIVVERGFIRPTCPAASTPTKPGRPSVGYEVNPLWASHYSQNSQKGVR